jgi:hypothetical protein
MTAGGHACPLGRFPTGGRGTGLPHLASTGQGGKGLRDEAVSGDGRYLYAFGADAQQLVGGAVSQSGHLTRAGAFNDLPGTVAGLAAS